MFVDRQRAGHRRAREIFGSEKIPSEVYESVERAHSRFPAYFRDTFSREAVQLCGSPTHLLKRDRNLLYSTMSSSLSIAVSDLNGLVPLKWAHLVESRKSDTEEQVQGRSEQEKCLTDNLRN